MTAAEFDVTPFLRAGENLLAGARSSVVGRKLPRGPGHWRLSGIYRDVFPLLDPEPAHLRLRRAHGPRRTPTATPPSACGRGCGAHDGGARRASPSKPSSSTPTARSVLAQPLVKTRRRSSTRSTRSATRIPSACSKTKVAAPPLVGGDTVPLHARPLPEDAKGAVVQATGTRVGFREVEVRGGRLLLNGRPIRFYGVDRHGARPRPRPGRAVRRAGPGRRADEALQRQPPSAPATTRTTRGGTSCATATDLRDGRGQTSRPTASPGRLTQRLAVALRLRRSARAGWWSGTRTTPRS